MGVTVAYSEKCRRYRDIVSVQRSAGAPREKTKPLSMRSWKESTPYPGNGIRRVLEILRQIAAAHLSASLEPLKTQRSGEVRSHALRAVDFYVSISWN